MQQSELRGMLRERFGRERSNLLPALHYVQEELGFLPEWTLQVVGWHLRVPASEIYGAATSYSELRLTPPGRHTVRVCTGLSCWHQGGQAIWQGLEATKSRSGADSFAGNPDPEFVLEETPCGFLCPMAPAVEVDGRWLGRTDAADVLRRLGLESATSHPIPPIP